MATLTAERLRDSLEYDPLTGVFRRRRTSSSHRAQAGKIAGTVHRAGYRLIRVHSRRYLAHRLAWLYVHGRWPSAEIDHVNGVKDDNRIENLREATRSQNSANSKKPITNTSGHKGVSFDKWTGRWIAYINKDGKMKNLGRYDSLAEAIMVRLEANRKAHGEFARA